MKKVFLVMLPLCGAMSAEAQLNVQLHYDMGKYAYGNDAGLKMRPQLTSTVEMFRPDKYGSTFFFVDMGYTPDGVNMAYWEISRDLKFWDAPISAHVEYNGGLNTYGSFNNCFLVGPNYSWNNESFSRGFTFSAMYKYIHTDGPRNNFQLTGTWYVNFAGNKCTFAGFADFWKEKTRFGGDYVFMTEPQFWVNLGAFKNISDKCNLSIGTEVEISSDFAKAGFAAIPTVGAKWTF